MTSGEKKLASQEIVEYFLRQIQDGNLKKGSHLPTELEMADMLDVSRIPLREAICALRTVGLLEARQGGGTYVTSVCDPSILGRMLYDFAILENVDLNQVIDVRLLLEPEAARQAALQGTQKQGESLLSLAEEYSKLSVIDHPLDQQNIRLSEIDKNFHLGIAKASHNDFLWMMLVVTQTSNEEMNAKNSLNMDEWGIRARKNFAEMHLEIARAIANHNGNLAKKCMEKHLQQVKRAFMMRP